MSFERLIAAGILAKANKQAAILLHKSEQEAYRRAHEQRAIVRKAAEERRLENLYHWNYRTEYSLAVAHWENHEWAWLNECLSRERRDREWKEYEQISRLNELNEEREKLTAYEFLQFQWHWQLWKQHLTEVRRIQRAKRKQAQRDAVSCHDPEIWRTSMGLQEQQARVRNQLRNVSRRILPKGHGDEVANDNPWRDLAVRCLEDAYD